MTLPKSIEHEQALARLGDRLHESVGLLGVTTGGGGLKSVGAGSSMTSRRAVDEQAATVRSPFFMTTTRESMVGGSVGEAEPRTRRSSTGTTRPRIWIEPGDVAGGARDLRRARERFHLHDVAGGQDVLGVGDLAQHVAARSSPRPPVESASSLPPRAARSSTSVGRPSPRSVVPETPST